MKEPQDPNQSVDMKDTPEDQTGVNSDSVGSRISFLSETVIVNDLHSTQSINLRETLHNIELKFITVALTQANGIVSHAAKNLGLQRTTLVEKMRKFNIKK